MVRGQPCTHVGNRANRVVISALLNTWQATVIKGNAGELAAIAKSTEVRFDCPSPSRALDMC